MYRAPLAVHVVWHPAFVHGVTYADALFRHLFEDPDDVSSHGLRIPVYHWRASGEPVANAGPPRKIPLDSAERAVVIPLVDGNFLGTPGWIEFLEQTQSGLRDGDELIPVQLSGPLPGSLASRQAIVQGAARERLCVMTLLSEVTHRLWQLLDHDGVKRVPAFISYARSDGSHIAERVRTFLDSRGSTNPFFAPRDVPRGDPWRDELRSQARRSVLVAIRSDAYAAREWCQIEVLEAKRGGMPVVVLDALARREARGFPYLGNGPVLRWRSRDPELQLEELLGLMLREALRFRYFELRVARLISLQRLPDRPQIQPAPPELLTMLERVAAQDAPPMLVYPDPPLGADELSIIRRLDRRVQPVTPLMVLAR